MNGVNFYTDASLERYKPNVSHKKYFKVTIEGKGNYLRIESDGKNYACMISFCKCYNINLSSFFKLCVRNQIEVPFIFDGRADGFPNSQQFFDETDFYLKEETLK